MIVPDAQPRGSGPSAPSRRRQGRRRRRRSDGSSVPRAPLDRSASRRRRCASGFRQPWRLSYVRSPCSIARLASSCSFASSVVVTDRPFSYSTFAPYCRSRCLRTSSTKNGATPGAWFGCPRVTIGFCLAASASRLRDVVLVRHALKHDVAARDRRASCRRTDSDARASGRCPAMSAASSRVQLLVATC